MLFSIVESEGALSGAQNKINVTYFPHKSLNNLAHKLTAVELGFKCFFSSFMKPDLSLGEIISSAL